MLFSKVLTYAFNAYLDAQICEEIVTYIRSNGNLFATQGTVAQERAQQLIATAGPDALSKDPSYLIGLAYTEYYINGLADLLYVDLLWPFLISGQKFFLLGTYKAAVADFRRQLTTHFQYQDIAQQKDIVFKYWPQVVSNPWKWATQFARGRCGFDGPLDKEALRRASLEVQHQNSQNNRQVAAMLRMGLDSDDPKVLQVRRTASTMKDPKAFITEAAATQLAAARWDKLFVWLIRR